MKNDSENYLISIHPDINPFEVDVAISSQHGSADFTTDIMKLFNPLATIISSGNNESYSHPNADAVGCACKYSRNARPQVFSTEIAVRKTFQIKNTLWHNKLPV
jgi:competence protein ComEC